MKLTGPILAALLASALPAAADTVRIAVGGSSCICYLPTVLAAELGHFEKHGVDVELIDFKGGSAALKAVVGGSADVVSGYYEHTISLAAKQQAMSAFVVLDRLPGIALTVAPGKEGEITSVKDLEGRTVGVSAPGSSTDFFLKYLLAREGLKPDAASVVGVGVGATSVAALEQGRIDAAMTLDPAITQLKNLNPDLKLLIDTRQEADTRTLFGADYAGGALYTRQEWIDEHPGETQALAAAIVDTLHYIHDTDPAEIAAQMPENLIGDPELYIESLKASMEMISTDGVMDPAAAEAVLKVMQFNSPEIAAAGIDVSKTYTNAFVEKTSQ
ncbi:ABC transporter substrate-binding protein [Falsirhodobacter sp. 1013]|uniref:ABC transporter substrate-binding protein n=1 Tax=Falsirhodobacter sp. 1013 TaxID=3417566 RepID=UPI003EBA5180